MTKPYIVRIAPVSDPSNVAEYVATNVEMTETIIIRECEPIDTCPKEVNVTLQFRKFQPGELAALELDKRQHLR